VMSGSHASMPPYGIYDQDDGGSALGHTRLYADWYCAPDDTTRSVAVAVPTSISGDALAGLSCDIGMVDYASAYAAACDKGDFYSGSFMEQAAFWKPTESIEGEDFRSTVPGDGCVCFAAKDVTALGGDPGTAGGADSSARFTEDHRPKALPSDPLFALEPTTIHIDLAGAFSPQDVGNDLLDFLRGQVAAFVLKVSATSLSVKTLVVIDTQSCTIKAKIFDKGDGGGYALELQKRSGDGVAFRSVYEKASAFFMSRPYSAALGSTRYSAAPVPETSRTACVPCGKDGSVTEHEIRPLLDMAAFTEIPYLQAESAASLASLLLQDPMATALFCTKVAIASIHQLLEASRLDVAYPTARLLMQLARSSLSAFWFGSEAGLLLRIVEKVRCQRTCTPVKTELAQVVRIAVDRCASELTAPARSGMQKALGFAVRELGFAPADAGVRRDLEEAHIALSAGGRIGGRGGVSVVARATA